MSNLQENVFFFWNLEVLLEHGTKQRGSKSVNIKLKFSIQKNKRDNCKCWIINWDKIFTRQVIKFWEMRKPPIKRRKRGLMETYTDIYMGSSQKVKR